MKTEKSFLPVARETDVTMEVEPERYYTAGLKWKKSTMNQRMEAVFRSWKRQDMKNSPMDTFNDFRLLRLCVRLVTYRTIM